MSQNRSSSASRARAQRFLLNVIESIDLPASRADEDVVDTLAQALDVARREDLLDAIELAIDKVRTRDAGRRQAAGALEDRVERALCDPYFFG